jgi:hypothetical protein
MFPFLYIGSLRHWEAKTVINKETRYALRTNMRPQMTVTKKEKNE